MAQLWLIEVVRDVGGVDQTVSRVVEGPQSVVIRWAREEFGNLTGLLAISVDEFTPARLARTAPVICSRVERRCTVWTLEGEG